MFEMSRESAYLLQILLVLGQTLVGKVGWLRMTTPKLSGDRRGSGHYVMRDGELVEGQGHSFQGRRAADGTTVNLDRIDVFLALGLHTCIF